MNSIDVATKANEAKKYLSANGFTTPESELAENLQIQLTGANPLHIYEYACRNFARGDAALIFTYTSFTWMNFGLEDIETLLSRVHPRPTPSWAWDGGEFADVSFFANSVGLNVFRLVNNSPVSGNDQERILDYGVLNSELLTRTTSVDVVEEDDCDPYYDLFLARRDKLRACILSSRADLDILDWNATQLEESIAELKANA